MKNNKLHLKLSEITMNNLKIVATELKNMKGVYQFINTINNKTYVGSSSNLGRRLLEYLNPIRLKRELSRGESIIYKSMLKYGYSVFEFKILELINITDKKFTNLSITQQNTLLRTLEQKYIDELKPEYNILALAGSNKGHKLSLETRDKISKAKKGKPSHRKDSSHTLESKLLMKLNSGRNKTVYVYDSNKILINTFNSITNCSKYLNISSLRIRNAIKSNKLINKTFYFTHIKF